MLRIVTRKQMNTKKHVKRSDGIVFLLFFALVFFFVILKLSSLVFKRKNNISN